MIHDDHIHRTSGNSASTSATDDGNGFPWLFLGLIIGSVRAAIAKRKGKNPLLWFFLGFIPVVGYFLAFVLASRPDVEVLNRIRRLEEQLAVDPAKSGSGTPPI